MPNRLYPIVLQTLTTKLTKPILMDSVSNSVRQRKQ